jgi:hypothetical protein
LPTCLLSPRHHYIVQKDTLSQISSEIKIILKVRYMYMCVARSFAAAAACRTENPSRVLCVHACGGIWTALCVRSLTRFSPAFFCAARAAQRKIAGARFYSALFAPRFMALRHGNSLIAHAYATDMTYHTRTQAKCARAHKNAINAQNLGHRVLKCFIFLLAFSVAKIFQADFPPVYF